MAEATFLDVNVFMYAAGSPHPYKDACVRILSDVETGALAAAVNTEIFSRRGVEATGCYPRCNYAEQRHLSVD